jgi:hypothetical protein
VQDGNEYNEKEEQSDAGRIKQTANQTDRQKTNNGRQ